MSWKKLRPLLLVVIGTSWPRVDAQTSTWTNFLGVGNWSDTLSWDVVPAPGNNVTINNVLLQADVTLDVNASVNQLTIGSATIFPAPKLTIADGKSLQLSSNSVINGSLNLSATSSTTELVIASGSLTLSGGGTVTLSGNSNNRIRGSTSNDGLINQVTIQGSGAVGNGQLGLVNQGTIVANNSAAPLVIAPSAVGVTNTGTLRATGNATLTLQSGAFNNAGGTIEVQTGSKVVINNSTVGGGNLTTTGTGTVEMTDATVAGVNVTNSANGIIRFLSGINTLYGQYTDFSTSQVRVSNGAKVVLPGGTGTVTLNGGIFLDSTGSNTTAEIGSSGLTINGTGRLVLSDNPNNRIIGGAPGATITIGPSITVQGAGQFGGGSLGLTNQGTFLADQPNALIVQPNGLGMSNSGTMRSTGGATLTLKNGSFTNTGSGSIIADSGSHIDVSASTINGGTLTSVGTGHFHALDSSVFSNLTISTGSTIEVGDGYALTLLGTITNNGLISMLSTGGVTELKMDSAVTINGTGNITLSNSANNRIHGVPGSSLTLGSSQTIFGAGEIGRDTMSLTNLGTITANQTSALVINNSGTSFTNTGTLRANGSGGLTLSDATVTNLGTIEVATGSAVSIAGAYLQSGGLTRLTGGTLNAGSFALQGGTLSGSGTVNGAVTASGNASIAPGGTGTVGTLTFNSTLNLGPTNTLFFDLGGTTPGTGHDRINGTNVALNGSLFLAFTNGFQSTIAPGDTLTLIGTSAALNGTFASLPNGSRLATTDGFGTFQVNYLSNALTISNFQPVPEPSTYVLFGVGIVGMWVAELRRRRRS